MKFQLYLTEGRSQKISFNEFVRLAPRCKNSLKSYFFQEKGKLMRGVNSGGSNFESDYNGPSGYGQFMSIEPAKFSRKPNYANNEIYFTMIDGLPSWSGYPSRRNSVVGATQGGKADHYDSIGLYQMFPEDSAKLVICSGKDLWASFGSALDTSKYDESLGGFVDQLLYFMSDISNKQVRYDENRVKTSSDLRAFCHTFDQYYKRFGSNLEIFVDKAHQELYEELGYFLKTYYKGDLWKAFDTAFSPSKNKIQVVRPGNSLPNGREWWSNGFCLMVEASTGVEDLDDDEFEALQKAVGYSK